MTNEEKSEVVDEAINKAFVNGWKPLQEGDKSANGLTMAKALLVSKSSKIYKYSVVQLLYDHDFAKALWGEKDWKTHVQRMVISKHPINYLKKNL